MKFELTDNRYKNRRVARDFVDAINENGFQESKANGWVPSIRAELHIIDRLSDREFPVDEFFKMLTKLSTNHEAELMEMATRKDGIPTRINVYGFGAWMIGVSINTFNDHKSFHINVRTCYAERNMVHRSRNVGVERIWTRGVPHWISNPAAYVEPEFHATKEGNK